MRLVGVRRVGVRRACILEGGEACRGSRLTGGSSRYSSSWWFPDDNGSPGADPGFLKGGGGVQLRRGTGFPEGGGGGG